jgi:hypothetical protein
MPMDKPRTQEDYDREVHESEVAALAEKLFVASYATLGSSAVPFTKDYFVHAEIFLKEEERRRALVAEGPLGMETVDTGLPGLRLKFAGYPNTVQFDPERMVQVNDVVYWRDGLAPE